MPHDSAANVNGDNSYVRVQVLTNDGALDREKQLAVVERLTDIVCTAAGNQHRANRGHGHFRPGTSCTRAGVVP